MTGFSRRRLLGGAAALGGTLIGGGLAVPDVSQRFPVFLSHGKKKPPTPTPSATGSGGGGTPGGSRLVFQETFASGNLNQWNSCQWNSGGTIFNNPCSGYDGTSMYSAQLANGGTDHATAMRFELRDGDIPFSGTERTEIAEPPIDVVPGDELWMAWDMKFDSTFPVPTGDWCIPWQWHGNGGSGSPPLVLDISSGPPSWGTADTIYLTNNDASGLQRTAIQPMKRNIWQHWMIHAKFSEDIAVGFAEVWIDGVEVVPKHFRRTIRVGDTGNYFKCGLYRDPVNTATAILWHDNIVWTAP